MRTIFLTLSILSAYSLAAFSQTQINPVKQTHDVYGAPVNNISFQWDALYSLSEVMTAYSYDSVRALTEINNPNFADAYPWISSDLLKLYYTKGSAIGKQTPFRNIRLSGTKPHPAPQ